MVFQSSYSSFLLLFSKSTCNFLFNLQNHSPHQFYRDFPSRSVTGLSLLRHLYYRRAPMRNEFIPFFRSTVGFDRLLDSLVDRANETVDDFPPYDIAKTGADAYRVTLAVAGFAVDDLEIVVQENFFSVSTKTPSEPVGEFLHRGIANRSFSRPFQL